MVIGSREGLRTVAKIAYVGLAHIVGVKIAAGDTFREVRQFIMGGRPEGVARLFINKRYLEACQQGPHQHSLAIAARRDKRRVDAIVRLFGELTYFVVLSDHYDGADFCTTIVYDAYRGEENGMLFAHEQAEILQMEDVATNNHTVWDDLEAFGEDFCAFLEGAVERKAPQGSRLEEEGGQFRSAILINRDFVSTPLLCRLALGQRTSLAFYAS